MKKISVILTAALLSGVFISCSCKQHGEIAIIEEISGEVFIIKNGIKQKAIKGIKLNEGDEIITDKKSSINLSYKNNKISIHEKSKLTIKKLKFNQKTEEKDSEFYLSEGRVSIDSTENTKQKNRLSIISNDSTSTSADSKFVVNTANGDTRIESKKGNVDTTNKKTGKTLNITTGQKISTLKYEPEKKPVQKIVPQEFSAVKPGVEVPKVK